MDEPVHRPTPHEVRANAGLRAFWGKAVSRAWGTTLDLLYPPRCALCGRIDTVLCHACATRLPPVAALKVAAPPPLIACAATGSHSGTLRRTIHAFKYESDLYTARRLALPLAARMVESVAMLGWTFDRVIPVPLHTRRLHARGYNQSDYLGAHVAHQLNIPYTPTALIRQRDTASQVGRTGDERRAAMDDAFTAIPDQVAGQILVLIDDVCTTGATLSACATAALAAGARRVYGLTISATSV
jgi:ComF family protein